MGWACGTYSEMKGVYRVLVRKPEGKKSLGILIRRWGYNIKMDLRKWNGRQGLDLSDSIQGQVAGTCKCGNESSGSVKCREFLG